MLVEAVERPALRPNPNSKSSPVPGGPAALKTLKAKKVMTCKLNLWARRKGGRRGPLLLALLGKVSWSLAPWPVTPSAATQGSSVSAARAGQGRYFFSRPKWLWAAVFVRPGGSCFWPPPHSSAYVRSAWSWESMMPRKASLHISQSSSVPSESRLRSGN